MRWNRTACVLVLSAALISGPTLAASPPTELGEFGVLVVGEWEAEDSRQVFEWGVGQRTIRSRSYHKSEEGWTLVGEGMWYWDPAEEAIRGVAVAIGMPVELFEYRSQVKDGEIVHDLVAQGPMGGNYAERWAFTDNEYRWSLEVNKDGKPEPIMAGSYRRVRGVRP